MNKLVEINPKCSFCGGSLELEKIVVNVYGCTYEIHGSCVVCGEDNYFLMGVEDIIELNQLLLFGDNDEKKE